MLCNILYEQQEEVRLRCRGLRTCQIPGRSCQSQRRRGKRKRKMVCEFFVKVLIVDDITSSFH